MSKPAFQQAIEAHDYTKALEIIGDFVRKAQDEIFMTCAICGKTAERTEVTEDAWFPEVWSSETESLSPVCPEHDVEYADHEYVLRVYQTEYLDGTPIQH